MNNVSFLNQKIKDCIKDNSVIEFEYEEIYEHDYPIEEKVPENWYYSKIIDVKQSSSSNNKNCIDVYYKLVPCNMLAAYYNEYTDTVKYYLIIQRYTKGTTYYQKFCASMYSALKTKTFTHKDIIGVTEQIHLTYSKDGAIGSISERKYTEVNSCWFEVNEETVDDECIEEN